MKAKVSCIALVGVFALQGFAQECNEVSLYKNGETGSVAIGNTFPEAPEWQANWGEMGSITPPYIRLSGSKNESSDWEANLVLNDLPTYVQGGNLTLDVNASRNAKFGIWFEGEFGKSTVYYQNLDSGKTEFITVPIASLVGTEKVLVQKLGVGLFNVPAEQYTTLFLDNISLSCSISEIASQFNEATIVYPYSDIAPSSPTREIRFVREASPQMTAAYTAEERLKIKDSTERSFLLSDEEYQELANYISTSVDSSSKLTAVKSREGWYKVMYLIDRNRLQDTVIANPKELFYEANTFTANTGNTEMPLLVANIDYAYRVCADTACETNAIENAHTLVAGLPSATVSGSVLRIHYDPYFITTNRNTIPQLEIYDGERWRNVPIKTSIDVNLNAAGRGAVSVRLTEGGLSIMQNLIVEAK